MHIVCNLIVCNMLPFNKRLFNNYFELPIFRTAKTKNK